MPTRKNVPGPVVCATDLTEAGDEALRQAHRASRASRFPLVLLHVLPAPLRQHLALPFARRRRLAALPQAHLGIAEAMRVQMARALGGAADEIDIRIEHGVPHVQIIACAEALRASLIVVGASPTHVGHEAERVVRYAHAPVLVARPSPARGAILAATDLSDAALPALVAAVAEARHSGSALSLLHVVDLRSLMLQPDLGVATVAVTKELREALIGSGRDHLTRALRRARVDGTVLVEVGDPASVILEAAIRLPARLVVMGTVGATGLSRMILGSVAETVVRRASCSALVVRLHPGARAVAPLARVRKRKAAAKSRGRG